MSHASSRLSRAIELSIEFNLAPGENDVTEFLEAHADLRDILEPLLSTEPAPETDEREVLGDFELVREIGRGGMGVVYEAIQSRLGRTVALKLLPPHRALSMRALAMFRREATLAASLDHPNIAKVLDMQEIDGQLALVMELIDGLPLDELLESLAGHPPSTLTPQDLATSPRDGDTWRGSYEFAAVELCRQVATALAHAHARGVLHRDVKPGNILITPEGAAVLTDFGLAREAGSAGMTQSGEFAGTYRYAAPEQIEGHTATIDGRTDVYALGATLYELLTLRHPVEAESLAEMVVRLQSEDPAPPSRVNPRVSPDLDAVVLCALEKDRNRRYHDAAEFASDLQDVLDRAPVKARRLSLLGRSTRWVRRNRLVSAFVATLTVTTLATALLSSEVHSANARYRTTRVTADLAALQARAERAHPIAAARLPELEALVAAGEELLTRREHQRRALAELRHGHLLDAPAARSILRPPHPATARIQAWTGTIRRLESELAAPGITADARAEAEAEVASLREKIAAHRAAVERSNRVAIPDPEAAALHDQIEAQLDALQQFAATEFDDLVFRRDAAERYRQLATDHAAAWRACAARVGQPDSRYGAAFTTAPLLPVDGLVPLGPDRTSGLEEFAYALSGEIPTRTAAGLTLTPASAIVFVLMPGGPFAVVREQFPVDVRLDPFLLGKHEMSRAQWRRLARGIHGLRWRDGGIADVRNRGQLEKPVNGITWDMCDRLLQRYALTLPTAVQWEYAATYDGGTDRTAAALAKVANLRDRAYREARGPRSSVLPFDDGFAGLAPIHAMAATPGGFHHLLGNVAEWCRDAFLPPLPDPQDGDGLRIATPIPNAPRVHCGGHWQDLEPMVLYDNRTANQATRAIGVRPAASIPRGGR